MSQKANKTNKTKKNKMQVEAKQVLKKESGLADDSNIMNIVEINKLTPSNAEFYLTNGGFIGLKENGEDKGRVGLHRMTPISEPTKHISVRNMDMKELGIIFDMNEFSKEQQGIMLDELNLRYFTPKIKEITSIKEEYGYTFISSVTDAGDRDFTMRDLSNNIIFLSTTRALLVDTDGNRYLIEDIKSLNEKALRIIGVWA